MLSSCIVNNFPIKNYVDFNHPHQKNIKKVFSKFIEDKIAKKNIGIESIVQKENLDKNLVPIVLISDAFIEKEHSDLLAQVLELESVNKIRSIRIEPN